MNDVKLPLRNRPPEVRLSVSVSVAKLSVPPVTEARRLSELSPSVPAGNANGVAKFANLTLAVGEAATPVRVPFRIWEYPAKPTALSAPKPPEEAPPALT